jgi:hypothetical protein
MVDVREVLAWTQAWARMVETSFLIKIIAGRPTALAIHTNRKRELHHVRVSDLIACCPRANAIYPPPPPAAIVTLGVFVSLCSDEIDARIPERP